MEPEELRRQLKKWAIIGGFFALALVFYRLGWRSLLIAYVVIVGVLSMAAVLIQSGRGGGLAASLGGMGGESLFGARSATPIAKATYVMLALFIFICMLIARLGFVGPARPADAGGAPRQNAAQPDEAPASQDQTPAEPAEGPPAEPAEAPPTEPVEAPPAETGDGAQP